ncbi:MAG: hypothetical protein IJ197_02285 [Bacteroidaceae bacterium]|nr:hypothetical protein [Bacteroidaceae bacterium]
MKKVYLQPETEVVLIQHTNMIALSLQPDPATGDDALVKEDNNWDIWGEEEAE